MKNFKWQKEALGHKSIMVRASRRAGKTTAALQWARSAGRRVLFVVPYQVSIAPAMNSFIQMYSREVSRYETNPCVVHMLDGTQITFIASTSSAMRGLRVDAIVLDEVGYMMQIDVLLACTRVGTDSIFATYSTPGGKLVDSLSQLPGIHMMTVDYLDLLAENVFTPQQIRGIQSQMTPGIFAEEFGPFQEKKPTNQRYKHLLTL